MSIGKQIDLLNDKRFIDHVKGVCVEKSTISIRGKIEYNNEITHRGIEGKIEQLKKPRHSAWKYTKRLSWSVDHQINDVEWEWVQKKFGTVIDKLDLKAKEDIIPESNIRVTDAYKMRLNEAYFLMNSASNF